MLLFEWNSRFSKGFTQCTNTTISIFHFSAAKELKKTQKATAKKSAPAAAAPKAAKAAKAAQKAQKPMQKAAPRVGGKR